MRKNKTLLYGLMTFISGLIVFICMFFGAYGDLYNKDNQIKGMDIAFGKTISKNIIVGAANLKFKFSIYVALAFILPLVVGLLHLLLTRKFKFLSGLVTCAVFAGATFVFGTLSKIVTCEVIYEGIVTVSQTKNMLELSANILPFPIIAMCASGYGALISLLSIFQG